MIRFALVSSLVGMLGGLPGCKQGVGDRCQVNSDCEDGLICVLPVGGTPQSGGVCETTGGVDMSSGADFAAPVDLSAAVDLSTQD
jgi:hypothetical protein